MPESILCILISHCSVNIVNCYIMKSLILSFLFSVLMFAGYAAANPTDTLKTADPGLDKEKCTFNGKPLYGKVKIVDVGADFKVKEVEYIPNLKVLRVEAFPDRCGRWQFVEDNEFSDFTIQFTDGCPDFTIQFVEAFPGIP